MFILISNPSILTINEIPSVSDTTSELFLCALLKSHIPFGVVADSLRVTDTEIINLTFNYRNIPEDYQNYPKALDSTRFYFINSLKEAFVLRQGSCKEVSNLSTDHTKVLLNNAIQCNNFDSYWQVNSTLLDTKYSEIT